MKQVLLMMLFFLPLVSVAAPLNFVSITDPAAQTELGEPTIKHAYYGELHDFPHSYKLVTAIPLHLSVAILEPNIKSAKQNISGIIVREVERGVEEVARLQADTAGWEKIFVSKTGDSYRQGASFEAEVPAGTYYIEVNNPDNVGKYVLQVGTEQSEQGTVFLTTLRDVYLVKHFFGKPFFMVLQSPYYYLPTLLVLFLGYRRYSKHHKKTKPCLNSLSLL